MDINPRQWFAPHLATLAAAEQLYVAYSGGVDSTVLLHGLRSLVGAERITAIHVNHHLSPNSDNWQQHCSALCACLAVRFVARNVSVNSCGDGLEQAARRARYQVFEELVSEQGLLLMAHHQDDQLETLIYRLMRGSGPKGLAGMPETRALGRGQLLRPFLNLPRSTLLSYALANELHWVEDESNQHSQFDRNFLRNELIPLVAARWPDYRQRLLRTIAQCDSAAKTLQEVASTDLQQVDERPERIGHSVDIAYFLALSRHRQSNLLSEWLTLRDIGGGGHKVIAEVIDTLIPARDDGNPRVILRGGEFRRFRGRLYLLPSQAEGPFPSQIAISSSLCTVLPDGSVLQPCQNRGSRALALQPGDGLTLDFRRGGERCCPAGKPGSSTLKKLLNEYGVEPWLRDRIPLIFVNGELAAVADLFVCREFCCASDDNGVSFEWQFPPRHG